MLGSPSASYNYRYILYTASHNFIYCTNDELQLDYLVFEIG